MTRPCFISLIQSYSSSFSRLRLLLSHYSFRSLLRKDAIPSPSADSNSFSSKHVLFRSREHRTYRCPVMIRASALSYVYRFYLEPWRELDVARASIGMPRIRCYHPRHQDPHVGSSTYRHTRGLDLTAFKASNYCPHRGGEGRLTWLQRCREKASLRTLDGDHRDARTSTI